VTLHLFVRDPEGEKGTCIISKKNTRGTKKEDLDVHLPNFGEGKKGKKAKMEETGKTLGKNEKKKESLFVTSAWCTSSQNPSKKKREKII